MKDLTSTIGKSVMNILVKTGQLMELFMETVKYTFNSRPNFKHVIQQMVYYGYESIPIVLLTATFIGKIFVLQTGYQLSKFGASLYAVGISAIAFSREIGPVFTAWAIASRVGASIAAEIGTMQVT